MQFAVLAIHSLGPETKVELKGMTGDEVNDLNFPTAKDAILEFEREKLAGPVSGGVLIYHEDNGQLCLMSSAKELREAFVIDDEELAEISEEIRLLKLAMKIVTVVVLVSDSDGKTALFPCLIECSKEECGRGLHFRAARWAADDDDRESVRAFDESDPAFAFLDFSKFGTLTTYNLEGKVVSGG